MIGSTKDNENKRSIVKGAVLARIYEIWRRLSPAAQYLLLLVTLYRREIHLNDDGDYEQLVIIPTYWIAGNVFNDLNCIVSCKSFDVLMVIKEDSTSRFSIEELSAMRDAYCNEHSGRKVFVLALGGLAESIYEQYEAHPELERKIIACSWHDLAIMSYELNHEFEGFSDPSNLRTICYTLKGNHLH